MANSPSVAPADLKRDESGHLALTKRCYGFNSWLVLGPLMAVEWQKHFLFFDPQLSCHLALPTGSSKAIAHKKIPCHSAKRVGSDLSGGFSPYHLIDMVTQPHGGPRWWSLKRPLSQPAQKQSAQGSLEKAELSFPVYTQRCHCS